MNVLKKVAASTAVALLAGLGVLGTATIAEAHDKAASVNCETASVSLTNYDRGATATIVLDGTTLHDGTFNGRLVASYPTGGNLEHTFSVTVRSNDGYQYNLDYSQTTSGCYTAPPVEPEPLLASADFTAIDAACINYQPVGNLAHVAFAEGVTASYTLDGGASQPLAGGAYDSSVILGGGHYIVTFTAQDGYEFDGGLTALTFDHTFPLVPTDCVGPPVEPVVEQHEESACVGTTQYTTRNWTTTDGAITSDTSSTRTLIRAEAIELGCYEPPVLECPEAATVGTPNEFGDPTECILPPVIEPPVEEPPTTTPPVTTDLGSLVVTGTAEDTVKGWLIALMVALLLVVVAIAIILVGNRPGVQR